ncbi:hypothetical protein BU26DRAFT_427481 [Trematosphaeria pertusa]|uniref:Uncharacterized protein n=1 Tax=Trematosphaeria pertusa TaxID=390896 RepID=A0A6A6IE54_9PLEO|nr:uncharacterized protein BU26DRAFT_427481 [Trematosphaeria pertusa]KAF2248706.1 hypothetical protein BU26DRAFT_427481 [Trematosphaeria pertusa]
MAYSPTVLSPLTLPALLNHVLTTQSSDAPTTLIICSSREVFLQDLWASLQHQAGREEESLHQLIAPSLHNLFTARHIGIAFCASVPVLLAHLTAYGAAGSKQSGLSEGRDKERVVLVNPLSLHEPTPSFSAQGLSRTFAVAVETTARVGALLCLVECQGTRRDLDLHSEEADVEMRNGENEGHDAKDPWEQEVSILNVSARRFGSGSGDRAWAGRTVKVKRIAGRWFRFQRHYGLQEGEGPG